MVRGNKLIAVGSSQGIVQLYKETLLIKVYSLDSPLVTLKNLYPNCLLATRHMLYLVDPLEGLQKEGVSVHHDLTPCWKSQYSIVDIAVDTMTNKVFYLLLSNATLL